MKTPDPDSDAVRAATKTEPARESLARRAAASNERDFEPLYLSLPRRRSHGQGRRNLAVGVVLLVVSGLLFAVGLYLAGPAAAYTVGGSLATGLLLYVVARARLLRQRNGIFLAAALVALLAVLLVLVQQGWVAVTRRAQATMAGLPAATPALASREAEKLAAPAPPPELPSLIDFYTPTPLELESSSVAKVVRNFNVEIDGKMYRIHPGDLFPVAGFGKGEVRLAAGGQEIAVPESAVSVTERKEEAAAKGAPEPAANDPKAVTRHAQEEAVRKYPALGKKDSRENRAFVEAYQELKFGGGAHFFDDPEWPLALADQLAATDWETNPAARTPANGTQDIPPTPRPQPATDNSPEPAPATTAPRTARGTPTGDLTLPER